LFITASIRLRVIIFVFAVNLTLKSVLLITACCQGRANLVK
jgi:hypothetical protein